jgi:Cobalt ATP-binding cassette C terminal.
MSEGNIVARGTPREVFYDDALLAQANLHPPAAVRIARDAGIDTDKRPVTEAELVRLLEDRTVTAGTLDVESRQ